GYLASDGLQRKRDEASVLVQVFVAFLDQQVRTDDGVAFAHVGGEVLVALARPTRLVRTGDIAPVRGKETVEAISHGPLGVFRLCFRASCAPAARGSGRQRRGSPCSITRA